MGCVQSRGLGACPPCLPRFIQLRSFSGTLLVISIAICSRFCSPEGVISSSCGNYGSFKAVGEARLAFRGLSCWEASVALCLWFRLPFVAGFAVLGGGGVIIS